MRAQLNDIKDYLAYNPDTGVFTWVKRPYKTRVQPGSVAGSYDQDGYRRIKFRGYEYRASRLAWFFVHGEMPPEGMEMDHKNLIRDDDRIENLRLATGSQNKRNRSGFTRQRKKRCYSTYKGVSFFVRSSKWSASIFLEGKLRHLGLFDNDEDAARAYDIAAWKHHGEFARLNFPKESAA